MLIASCSIIFFCLVLMKNASWQFHPKIALFRRFGDDRRKRKYWKKYPILYLVYARVTAWRQSSFRRQRNVCRNLQGINLWQVTVNHNVALPRPHNFRMYWGSLIYASCQRNVLPNQQQFCRRWQCWTRHIYLWSYRLVTSNTKVLRV